MRFGLVALAFLASVSSSGAEFKVTPLDLQGADGVPDAVDVESSFYKFRFVLWETGSAQSMVYKPLNHELRAENYYSNHNNMFRDWVRLADPDPVTGFTRSVSNLEIKTQSSLPATYRVVRQDANELVLEFEVRNSTEGGQPWMAKILSRRRIFLRNDTPAIRVENEIVNADTQAHSVVFDVFNGLSLGRVQTWVSMPGPEGKIGGVDRAEEGGSSFLFAPEPADAWIGGVNEKGLGGGFSFEWPDVDAMQVCMYKTVGSCYHVMMRRREIPAGKFITFKYTFMPFTGLGAFDGMNGDLAGGFLVGEKANYVQDVAEAELKAGASLPVRVFLVSGANRQVKVRLLCVRKEDGKAVLDETKSVPLKVAETATLASKVTLGEEGLYVLTVTGEAEGVNLKMEKPLEVGKTKLAYAAAPIAGEREPIAGDGRPPAGEKRGKRDAGESLGPPSMDPQFRTLDLKFVTPHLPVLKNHARGPLKAFFLTPADSTLGHVREIVQRADIAPEYCAVTKIQLPRGELHPRDLAEFVKKLRAAEPQVLVTLGIDWQVGLKAKLMKDLLDRVKNGMGVVIETRDVKAQPELEKALAEGEEIKEMPVSAVAVATPPIRAFRLGKGRVVLVVCNWNTIRDAGKAALEGWTTLRAGTQTVNVEELRWRGFEYSYAHLAEWIRWAAGQDTPIAVVSAALFGRQVAVSVRNASGQPVRAKLTARLRSRRWEEREMGEASVEIPPGESEHDVELPRFPEGGPVAMEIDVRGGDNRVLAFASAAAVEGEWVVMKVVPQPQYPPAEKPGSIAVEMASGFPAGRLRVEVTDRFERVVLRQEQEVQLENGKGRVEIPLAEVKPLCVYHEVVAQFLAGERLLAEASGDLFLLPSKPPYADAFMLGVWGAPERDVLMIQGMLTTTHDVGLTLHSHSYEERVLYSTGGFKTANIGLSPKERYARAGEKPSLDSEKLIMTPPLLPSAEAVQAKKAEWQAAARKQHESGAWMVGIDDERRMSDDFDFHPQTLAAFREWLKKRYADIAELNKTWGANFADFGQVVPKRRKELGDSPNLAPWLEFRMFIGDVLGDYYMKAPAEWAAEISPELSAGEWGVYEPSTAWPVDWSRYAKCYKYTARYGGNQGILEELFRCFAPATRHGQWMGYGMREISPDRRIAPWQSLLNGGSFCWFWEMRDEGFLNYSVLTSDQRPTAGYAALAKDEFPDLTSGIDRLILASKFTTDKIAIGYSYPSWLCDTDALARNAKVIVEELGFQHDFVTIDDVAAGRLEKDGYKLLILQQASCLSKEQVDAVKRFVEGGGLLFCIGRTGWRDLHGAPHPNGSLTDELTGLDTSKAAPLGRTMVTVPGDPHLWLFVADSGIEAKGARVLAHVGLDDRRVPVWSVRDVGKGKVYWLNSTLAIHRAVHTGGVAGERSVAVGGPEAVRQSHWDIFEHVIAMAGLKPRCRLFENGKPVFDAETWYYETPSGRTLIVARHLSRKTESVLVRLQRKGFAYELRTKRCFGDAEAFGDGIPEGTMRIYAVLEYRVIGMTAKVDEPRARPGDIVRLKCTLKVASKDKENGKAADLHPIRVRVTGPQGTELPAYRMTLMAQNGEATAELPLALDQPPGTHSVHVVDVISGAETRAVFAVLKPTGK